VARQIAINLPDDLTLVVKDHPAMYGKRPFSYLEKILKTPNVKLISPHYNGIHVIKNCEVLIAPTGTSFHEAAILKKPAILLGNWSLARILPNVIKIFHFREIPKAFKELKILSETWNEEFYDKQLLIHMSAGYEVGFDYNYMKLWTSDYNSEEDLDGIFNEYCKEIMY
jgi:CDP-glycerol glycerophosphotransferase (TagB/SpsB family)